MDSCHRARLVHPDIWCTHRAPDPGSGASGALSGCTRSRARRKGPQVARAQTLSGATAGARGAHREELVVLEAPEEVPQNGGHAV